MNTLNTRYNVLAQKVWHSILEHAVLFSNRPLTSTEYDLAKVSLQQLEQQASLVTDIQWATLDRKTGLSIDQQRITQVWRSLQLAR